MCADIQIQGAQMEECSGKCLNGGVCQNGECKCRKGYSGKYCGYKDVDSSGVLYYFIVFLALIAVIAALFYASIRIIKNVVRIIDKVV
jgi:hypothetical protein